MNTHSSHRSDRRSFIRAGFLGMGLCAMRMEPGWSTRAAEHSDQRSLDRAFEVQFPAMGSLLTIRWLDTRYSSEDEKSRRAKLIRQQAVAIAERWNMVMSDYEEASEASQVAIAGDKGDWQPVSTDLSKVLDVCNYWSRLSHGAFDASLGAMTKLRRKRSLPTPQQWKAAGEQVGWNFVEWESTQSRVRFQKPGIRFDFGAIGKGWVADEIYELLLEEGIPCCSVDFAGNMRLGQAPPGTKGWPVSIDRCEVPVEKGGERPPSQELCRLRLSDCGISTSGDRWQRFPDSRSADKSITSSHILDPKSMEGIDQVQNVTLIARTARDADAASTATSVLQTHNLADWLTCLSNESKDYRWILQSIREDQLYLRGSVWNKS